MPHTASPLQSPIPPTAADPARDMRALIAAASACADAARPETLRFFRRPDLAATSKETARFDPVTEGDRAAERAMRAVLAKMRPDDAIFGEEYGTTPGTSGLTWVLDPIDGTRGYLSGTPTWGVLIAVCEGDRPVAGIIDQPYIGERFIGAPGMAVCEGPQGLVPLVTRQTRDLADAILYTTFPEIGTGAEAAAFRRVADKVRLTRYGLDCYAYALIAAGQVDLVIEAGLQRYDVAAPIAVIEAAGGIVTDWSGGRADLGGQVLAAANPAIHAAALAALNGGA